MPNVTPDEPKLRSSQQKGRVRRIASGVGNGHAANGAAGGLTTFHEAFRGG